MTSQLQASVAVVIPCFNDGATLVEAVRSAQGQPRVKEIVVVDDGSTDPLTLDAFSRLEAQRVTVVHRQNGGLAAARMSGVDATTSEYVLPLDADDRLMPGTVGALAGALDHEQQLALVWGDYRLFGDHSYRQQTADQLDPWQITYQNDLPSTALIRRSALLDAGGWEKSYGYEDWDLWMSLAERLQQGRRVPIVVYEYRQHGIRMLGKSASRHDDTYRLLHERHPALFAGRRAAWSRSPAPLSLRLALPLIARLPMSANAQRLLGGAACHLACGRGVRLLVHRARQPWRVNGNALLS